jgi:glycosyltransferase involved in cell wall biosynthesis
MSSHTERNVSEARRRRVLVCAPFPPRLEARHGGRATSQLLRRLAERNDIALLCFRPTDEEGVDLEIARHCDVVEEVPLAPKRRVARYATWGLGMLRGLPPWATSCRSEEYAERLRRLVGEWEPEVVEIHLQAMAQYVETLHEADIASILVDYDPGSAWADEVRGRTAGPRRIARSAEVAAWRRYEQKTRPRFDAIVVFAERDVAAVEPTAGDTPVVRVPLAVEIPPRPLDPEGSTPPRIVFVGGFAHPPNVDAAVWLATRVFPRVLERVPDARLDLVGHEPGEEVRALDGGLVSVYGSVPDVTPYLDRAAVVAAPIRIGGSMRMKVLEALAAGKALVATPRAAEGVEATPGEHYLLAAGEDQLVDDLARLLLDPRLRRSLGEQARAWATENLGWDRGLAAFERLYDDVIAARRSSSSPMPTTASEAART